LLLEGNKRVTCNLKTVSFTTKSEQDVHLIIVGMSINIALGTKKAEKEDYFLIEIFFPTLN
jgi:hypothetical protein